MALYPRKKVEYFYCTFRKNAKSSSCNRLNKKNFTRLRSYKIMILPEYDLMKISFSMILLNFSKLEVSCSYTMLSIDQKPLFPKTYFTQNKETFIYYLLQNEELVLRESKNDNNAPKN